MSGTGSSSSSGSGGNRKIIGFTVKKRTITLPISATVSEQYCETITEECSDTCGSGSGSSSGSGGGSGGTIETACCPGLQLPTTITGTFTSTTGFASAWPTSASFTYSEINQYWIWDTGPDCGDGPADLELKCNAGNWELYSGVNRVATSPTASTSESCDPFIVVFDVAIISAYCGLGSYTVTFTI